MYHLSRSLRSCLELYRVGMAGSPCGYSRRDDLIVELMLLELKKFKKRTLVSSVGVIMKWEANVLF